MGLVALKGDTMLLNLSQAQVELLQMALYEYVHARGPTTEAYVARRYEGPNYTAKFLAAKIESVNERKEEAIQLRKRLFVLHPEDNERKELNTMSNRELIAYWNILQMGQKTIQVDDDGQNARHTIIVDELLTERAIPHEHGKLINTH
jgi:hypothetical protein